MPTAATGLSGLDFVWLFVLNSFILEFRFSPRRNIVGGIVADSTFSFCYLFCLSDAMLALFA